MKKWKKNVERGISTWWGKWKKFVWTAIAFLIPYFVVWIIFHYIGYLNEQGKPEPLTWGCAFYKAVAEPFISIIAFIISICVAVYQFNKENDEKQTELIKKLDAKVEYTLTRSKIVFESGINDFNDEHLLALHKILWKLNDKTNVSIYAIDNSDPRAWWSDTMTGYLALLAKWKAKHQNDDNRIVHRIFVCQKDELLNPIFAKTICLHSLMGFKTYVIVYEKYIEILKNVQSLHPALHFPEKEVFIWTEPNPEDTTDRVGNPFEIKFQLDQINHSKEWEKVKCYQSFWNIKSDYHYRNILQRKGYKGNKREWLDTEKEKIETTEASIYLKNFYGQEENAANIPIWFEFISKEKNDCSEKEKQWENLPKSYIILIKALLDKSKMPCVKNTNEIKHIKNLYGIEIRTLDCSNDCTPQCTNGSTTMFDFTSQSDIKSILQEYYNKLK